MIKRQKRKKDGKRKKNRVVVVLLIWIQFVQPEFLTPEYWSLRFVDGFFACPTVSCLMFVFPFFFRGWIRLVCLFMWVEY